MIPAVTDPLGQFWEQPPREAILVDTTHAVMTEVTFKQLKDYSSTVPTGVYDGKMWRRQTNAYAGRRNGDLIDLAAHRHAQTHPRWVLCWYAPSRDPTKCVIESREILLCQAG